MGDHHNCGLSSIGRISCWGIDDGSGDDYGQVSGAPTDLGFTALAADQLYNCAIASDGSIVCWGNDGNNQSTNAPSGQYIAMEALGNTLCCSDDDLGAVACWGVPIADMASLAPLR